MTKTTIDINKKIRRKTHRVDGLDAAIAEEIFKNAAVFLLPEHQKQRTVFKIVMPYLFVLRNKGCSWEELTNLLNACGFKLKPTTVRTYFGEMIQVQIEQCGQVLNEHLLLVNEVEKLTVSVDIFSIAERVDDIVDKQRVANRLKLQEPSATAQSLHTARLGGC